MSRKSVKGQSKAYINFLNDLWKFRQLVQFGVVGIDKELENRLQPLLNRFAHVKGIRGRRPKAHEPQIKKTKEDAETMTFEMDARSAALLKKSVEENYKRHDELRYFFYANLAVTLWATFETYNALLFEELFRHRPSMLKSSEQITIQDAIENRTDILEFLIERQAENIGHLKLMDITDYYKKKTGIEIPATKVKRLELYYLVRNLVAHKNGILRPRQKIKASEDLRIVGDQVRISRTFLLRMASVIESTVNFIEGQACAKYFAKEV
jgi:hypothetical protein